MRPAYAAMLAARVPCVVCGDPLHDYEQERHPHAGEVMCASCLRCNGGAPDPYASEMPCSACRLLVGFGGDGA